MGSNLEGGDKKAIKRLKSNGEHSEFSKIQHYVETESLRLNPTILTGRLQTEEDHLNIENLQLCCLL